MTDAPSKTLADLFDGGDTVMLMTMIGQEHTSRPMTIAGVDGSRLAMLVDTTAEWYSAVASGSAVVHVTLSDVRHNEYAALNGTAAVTSDRAEIERYWNPGASAFFDGKDDPNLAVLYFDVDGGEYWTAPSGRIGSLIAMAKAALGGDEAAGEQGSITTA
jgi:general stress protein 26